MTRRMSCSMTIDAVRERRKTVTRRRIDTWLELRPGDKLTLIEKGMGLPKGAKQVTLAHVEIVSVTEETLARVDQRECELEGFPDMTPVEFVAFWAAGHGVARGVPSGVIWCRRIEWRYLDQRPQPPQDPAPC